MPVFLAIIQEGSLFLVQYYLFLKFLHFLCIVGCDHWYLSLSIVFVSNTAYFGVISEYETYDPTKMIIEDSRSDWTTP